MHFSFSHSSESTVIIIFIFLFQKYYTLGEKKRDIELISSTFSPTQEIKILAEGPEDLRQFLWSDTGLLSTSVRSIKCMARTHWQRAITAAVEESALSRVRGQSERIGSCYIWHFVRMDGLFLATTSGASRSTTVLWHRVWPCQFFRSVSTVGRDELFPGEGSTRCACGRKWGAALKGETVAETESEWEVTGNVSRCEVKTETSLQVRKGPAD